MATVINMTAQKQRAKVGRLQGPAGGAERRLASYPCRSAAMAAKTLLVFLVVALAAPAQTQRGTIRIRVRDPQGQPLRATVELGSRVNQLQQRFNTDKAGRFVARGLPYGLYRVRVMHSGFAPAARVVEVRSSIPLRVSITLRLKPVKSHVRVTSSATLIDPDRLGTVYTIGSKTLQTRLPAQMGRGISDAVDSQPGWLYEANGVLHPRGSEYDVQYVINGVPFTENRSPAFAPPLAGGDVQSIRVLTAGFPAEYGRKLGGVVEITTRRNFSPGFHWSGAAEAGSFATSTAEGTVGYDRGRNQWQFNGNVGTTDRYLDPPVLANYTNHGSTGGLAADYARDLSDNARLHFFLRRAEVRYEVPNELVQQQAGQRQQAADTETDGVATYEQVLSPTLLLTAVGSLTTESFHLESNRFSTPVIVSQQRGFRRGYGRLSLAGADHHQDWQIGADAFFTPVHEALQYQITNPSLFDAGTALRFRFADRATDIEPAAFVQENIHGAHWNLGLGMRYDDYHFVARQSAWSPRVAISHAFSRHDLVVHFAYDRVFQTPALENLLLASSPQLERVSPLVQRLPVQPARANYYEAGFTKGFLGRVSLTANVFERDFRNFSDDDTLLNTGVSFPIADARAWIRGVEGQLAFPNWGRFSGTVSYANQLAVGQGPVTGGLLIGAEALANAAQNERFWISQDQRNTAHASLRWAATRSLWLAMGSSYGSGLPVELDSGDTSRAFLLSQYGSEVLSHVDFPRGRVRPSFSLDAGAGLKLYGKENSAFWIQVQCTNLTNHLNVINFASLFSGTAIGAPRSFDVGARAVF